MSGTTPTGPTSSASAPPAARAAVSSAPAGDDEPALEGVVGERRAGLADRTRRRSPGANAGRDAAAARPSAAGSNGTVRQRDDGQARVGEDPLDQRAAPRPPADGRAAGTAKTTAGRPAVAAPASSWSSGLVERQGDPGAVARLAVGAERAAMAERREPGQGQRQDPVARPAARVRDEPDAARVVLEARVVQRGRCAVADRRWSCRWSPEVTERPLARWAAAGRMQSGSEPASERTPAPVG